MRRMIAYSCGFTLIELLVVIAIVATLIGILLPALAGARETSRTVKCSSGARSIAQSLHMYSDEWRERYPSWSAWHTYQGDESGDDTPGPGWAEQLEPYLQVMEIYRCPSRRQQEVVVAFFLQSRFTAARNGGRLYTSLNGPDIQFSQQFVLTGDATNPALFSRPYGDSVKAPNVDPDDARWQAVFYANERRPHSGGKYADGGGGSGSPGAIDPSNPGQAGNGSIGTGNVSGEGAANLGFMDGHVSAFTRYRAGAMTWSGRAMTDWTGTQ